MALSGIDLLFQLFLLPVKKDIKIEN